MMGKAQQALTGVAATFAAMLMGSLNVWPSYTVELYTSPNNTVLTAPMSEFQISLVGSLPSLGAMLGTLVTGVLINYFGRKRGAILLSLPYIVHWVMIKLYSSATPIIIARFIGGIPGGAYVVYAPIYISEICEPSIRGTLASGPVCFYSLGTLVSYLNGWFLSYDNIVWVNLAMCALNLVLLSVAMESPVFYLKQNKEQAALKALAYYRDGLTSSENVIDELSAMKQHLLLLDESACIVRDTEERNEEEKSKLHSNKGAVVASPNRYPWKLLFSNPSHRRPFVLVWVVMTNQVLIGAVAIQVYAGELFSKATPELSADFCSVLVALVLFAGSVLNAAITDKVGRRVLIISSSALAALSICALGLQLQTAVAPPWVAAVTVLIFNFVFTCGAGSVPYVLLAEVFSPEVQSVASIILVEWLWFTCFVLIAVFPFLVSAAGVHGACYVFACAGAVNALYSRAQLPETKGLTRRRIQAIFDQ